jgi:peptidoglycan/xylan/chitin deacetylase (PgdA/CDA1 family)
MNSPDQEKRFNKNPLLLRFLGLGRPYFVKTPFWLKKIYPSYIWNLNTTGKEIYLTFDDGPHPEATEFVLKELKKYDAMATFFCIGKNVLAYPEVYKRILDEGHAVGNHTQNHLNGWKTHNDLYMKDIAEAANHIDSNLFRPPYGRITSFQAKHLKAAMKGKKAKVVMWDILSGDFDADISSQQVLENVIFKSKEGSIIVFHDSEKCYPKLTFALPRVLEYFTKKNYRFLSLELN